MYLDVTNWEADYDKLTTGAREKVWLKKEGEYYLFKKPHIFGEIYAEYVAYLIGTKIFNLTIPEVTIARRDKVDGIISKNFIDQTNNSQYIEIVDYYGANFDQGDLYDYTVESSVDIVDELGLLPDFITMCLFDFIIANQDRHCENWGILQYSSGYLTFAPLYDHGSSLCNGYDERRVKKMLLDKRQFSAYTNRAETIFTVRNQRRPRVRKLIDFFVGNYFPTLVECINRFRSVEYDIIMNTISKVDSFYITTERKQLIAKLICHRVELLDKWISGRGKHDG